MKLVYVIIALAAMALFDPQAAHAGFWVKSQTAAVSATAITTHKFIASPSPTQGLMKHPYAALGKYLPRHRNNSGWEGIVSFGCGIVGIVGLFAFFPADLAVFLSILAYPAIVFGILGRRHGKRHRGIALAGLILGVVVILLWALVFAIIFAALAGL